MRPRQDRVGPQPLVMRMPSMPHKRYRTWKSSGPCTAWLNKVPEVVTISVTIMVKVSTTSEAIPIPVVVIIPVNRKWKKTIIIDIPVNVTVKTEVAEMGIEAVLTSRSLLRPPKWWGPHLKRWAAVEWCELCDDTPNIISFVYNTHFCDEMTSTNWSTIRI